MRQNNGNSVDRADQKLWFHVTHVFSLCYVSLISNFGTEHSKRLTFRTDLSQTRWSIICNSLSAKALQKTHQNARNKKTMSSCLYNHFFAFVIKNSTLSLDGNIFGARNKNVFPWPFCNQNLTGITKKYGTPAEKQFFRQCLKSIHLSGYTNK